MILDPTLSPDANVPLYPEPVARVSSELRNFGYVPDIRQLRTGDLLFTQQIQPNLLARLIARVQRAHYAQSSEWTHVAIYISDWQIIHCRPLKGVHVDTLLNLVLKHRIAARRLTAIAQTQSTIAENLGLKIALESAMDIRNSKYDYYGAFMVFLECLRLKLGFSPVRNIPTPYIHMCSTLYVRAVLTLGIYLHSGRMSERNNRVTPQMLHQSPAMQDVPLAWAKLPS